MNEDLRREITNLAECLNAMGAKVTGAGTDVITIEGVSSLHGALVRMLAYMPAASAGRVNGNIKVL